MKYGISYWLIRRRGTINKMLRGVSRETLEEQISVGLRHTIIFFLLGSIGLFFIDFPLALVLIGFHAAVVSWITLKAAQIRLEILISREELNNVKRRK